MTTRRQRRRRAGRPRALPRANPGRPAGGPRLRPWARPRSTETPTARSSSTRFAHGGIVYRLRHDAAFIEAEMTEAGDGAPFVLAGLMPQADDLARSPASDCAISRPSSARSPGPRSRRRSRRRPARHGGTRSRPSRPPDGGRGGAKRARAARRCRSCGSDPTRPGGRRVARGDRRDERALLRRRPGRHRRVASLVHDEALGRERLVFSREQDIKLLYAHRHYVVGIQPKGCEIWKGLGEAWLERPAAPDLSTASP